MTGPSAAAATRRLFVAVNLAVDIRQSLATVVAPLRVTERAVSWVAEPNLHLTLRFLGEQPAKLVAELSRALRDVGGQVPAHELILGAFGAFPSLRRPRVLWLGVSANVASASLYQKVDDACAALGLGREAREFHAHVTLGRVRPRATPAPATLVEAARLLDTTWTTPVTTVDLMSSQLGSGGARYECLVAAPLTGSER
jgi:2'-5' RNA ligase